MKKEDKKALVLIILTVLFLIFITASATFAYFTFKSQNDFGTQKIDANIEELGNGVTLENLNNKLKLDVKVTDMLSDKIGTTYYASGSSSPAKIAKLSTDGAGSFYCSYTLEATPTHEDAMNPIFLNVRDKDVLVLTINDKKYDFYDESIWENGKIVYKGIAKGVQEGKDQFITANLSLKNTSEIQNILEGDSGSLQLEVKDFNCIITPKINDLGGEIYSLLSNGVNISKTGEMYRYEGTNEDVLDNYLCFGTSDKDTCLNNPDKYMYRIIGINDSGLVKVIKKEALDVGMKWAQNVDGYIPWYSNSGNMSSAFTELNGNSFLENKVYIPEGWSNKIVSVDWKYGNMPDGVMTQDYYAKEKAFDDSVNAKIGLLYMSDYTLSSNLEEKWISLGVNDLNPPDSEEWTMQIFKPDESPFTHAFTVGDHGIQVIYHTLDTEVSVRPVFYIGNSTLISGTGIITDPFIIS